MTEPSAIDAASKRLALALDALAAAVERRHEADRGEQTLDAQLHALGADRSRLASELDAAAAPPPTPGMTNSDVPPPHAVRTHISPSPPPVPRWRGRPGRPPPA